MLTIANQRLINQKIFNREFILPEDAVHHLGAVQAQDYSMSKWAVGVRTKNATDALVEQALEEGRILRTHILRPTWHLVSPKDIRWMLALSAPHIHPLNAHYCRKLELTDQLLQKIDELIARILEGEKHLTKAEIMDELTKNGINTSDSRGTHILIHAELNGVICNGKRQGNQITYALLDERALPTPTYSREESLGLLARRYFQSHGPATLQDFIWWSGLKTSDARMALESVKKEFNQLTINDITYWSPDTPPQPMPLNTFLLPAFDEFMVSYKDRKASLDSNNNTSAITANGIFKPIIVVDGKVEGLWNRAIKKGKVSIEAHFFQSHFQAPHLDEALQTYATFLEKEIAN